MSVEDDRFRRELDALAERVRKVETEGSFAAQLRITHLERDLNALSLDVDKKADAKTVEDMREDMRFTDRAVKGALIGVAFSIAEAAILFSVIGRS